VLRLQTGRFDAPDRLFCSVAESWDSVTTNPTDVKELIPEFYLPTTNFLINKNNLPLGTIHTF
jgi:factor associated with neutral sphingomyelinase activation